MDAPYRGTAQSLSAGFGFPFPALFHQVLVELLKVTGSQLGQLDVSDAGDRIGVDHQIVAVCCGYPHIGLGIEVIPGFEPGSDNIAPSETECTCRKVGAHRKEAQGKANRTPAQVEYDRAYNRLKQRKNRKKISVEEWNASVAEAMKVLEQSEQGKLDDEEMRSRFKEF